jgi:hypothetical protein
MRDDSLLPHLFKPTLLDQPDDSMECAPHLERSNTLEVLALEKQPHFRRRGLLSLPWRSLERFDSLRRRSERGQRRIGEHWGAVDVGSDERVGGFDGDARQGTVAGCGRRLGRHAVNKNAVGGIAEFMAGS